MSEQKLTPWFPRSIKPARPGVYQTEDKDLPGDTYYNLWDGNRWYYGHDELERYSIRSAPGDNDVWPDGAKSLKHWRGLARRPR